MKIIRINGCSLKNQYPEKICISVSPQVLQHQFHLTSETKPGVDND